MGQQHKLREENYKLAHKKMAHETQIRSCPEPCANKLNHPFLCIENQKSPESVVYSLSKGRQVPKRL